ncbi:hypothetical protein K0B03_03330 [Patescibacteria group bacterium]|nr:hypothetical protein [Patescibacteria group bacterium]
MVKETKILPIKMQSQQPIECGPACLFAIFKQYNINNITEEEIISKVSKNSFKQRDWLYRLGAIAQEKELKTSVITLSTSVIDLSWQKLKMADLSEKIKKRKLWFNKIKRNPKIVSSEYLAEYELKINITELEAMIKYIKKGGFIKLQPLTLEIIKKIISQNKYIIAALDATIAFNSPRILKNKVNDIKGSTWGHIVIINGYKKNKLKIANPSRRYTGHYYDWLDSNMVIEAIVRRDRNILVVGE